MTPEPETPEHGGSAPTPKPRGRYRGKLRRRVSSLLALALALMAAGSLYALAAPQPQTAVSQAQPAPVRDGQRLYNNHCITCHGANLQGEVDRGPSLIGVGEAAVYFQVSSGRMPLARQEAQAERKPPKQFYHADGTPMPLEEAALALGAFVQANGGGPQLPAERGEALRGENPARGGELFRLNCASCHNFTGRGGALSSGKFAPDLQPATELQIYTAMLTGPQNMPKFSDRQLTPEEKRDIVAYVKSVTGQSNSPGGYALGGFGPISEAVAVFLFGLAILVGVALWMGAKA
jgi:ubiquinol-cytochrome c reductase cytochrome c subunit